MLSCLYTVKKVSDFLYTARESSVSDILAGDGKIASLFLQCSYHEIHLYKI